MKSRTLVRNVLHGRLRTMGAYGNRACCLYSFGTVASTAEGQRDSPGFPRLLRLPERSRVTRKAFAGATKLPHNTTTSVYTFVLFQLFQKTFWRHWAVIA